MGRYSQVRSGLVEAEGRGHGVPSTAHSMRSAGPGGGGSDLRNRLRSAATSSDPSAKASDVLGQRRRKLGLRLWRTSVVGPAAVSTASANSNKLSWRRPRSSYSSWREWRSGANGSAFKTHP